MPAYNSFNLATKGRNGQPNITTNYYNGVARPNPVGDALGNNTAAQTRPTTGTANLAGQGWTQGQSATPYLQQFLGGRNPYGTAGLNIENSLAGIGSNAGRVDPRLYNYGYTQIDGSEGGSQRMFQGNPNVNERGQIIRNGQTYSQVGESLDRIIDPTKVEYDPEFGLITDPSNISMPEGNLEKYMPYIVAAGLAGPVAAHALSTAGGAAASTPELLGGTGGVTEYSTGSGLLAGGGEPVAGAGTLAETGGTWSSASGLPPPASGVGPVAGPVGYEGAAPGATAGGGGLSGALNNPLLRSAAGNIIGGIANYYLGNRAQTQANNAANRADTWGEDGRNFAKQKLFELYDNPSSVENTPGYKFRQQQGEQGINRTAAKTGYFRSPNMLYDLSKFNQDLAQTTWDKEFEKYAAMAGLSFNPSSAAQLQQQGNQRSDNMRAASITQIIGAGGNFFDWLNSVG